MALPSQTERSSETNRTVMGQPQTGTATRVAIVIAGLVLLAGGVYALNTWGSKSMQPKTTTAGTTTGTTTGTAPSLATKSTPPITTPATTAPTTTTPAPSTSTLATAAKTPITPATTPTTTPVTTTAAATPPGTIPFGTPGASPSPTTPTTTPATTTPTTTTPTTTTPATTADATPAPVQPVLAAPTPADPASLIAAGNAALASNKLLDARTNFSRALLNKDTSDADKEMLRGKLQTLNQDLLFSAIVTPGDPMAESYKVQPGDSLVRIARRRELATDWRLIQRINRISNPNALRAGQTLKLVKGPFHAVVNKAGYRVDIYQGSPTEPASWTYIKSYKAGLGEGNSTPLGNYTVKKNSKLINPPWVNPRTGEKFGADDPKNPIGERWIGWQGMGDSVANTGYGFHGTIDPDSIGQQKSMGCVRLGNSDVEELYELLSEEVSVVRVMP